jgi:hypothetical protein
LLTFRSPGNGVGTSRTFTAIAVQRNGGAWGNAAIGSGLAEGGRNRKPPFASLAEKI